MKVHHLNCGTLRPAGGGLVDGQPGLFRRAELVCHCLLLETDQGLVLVETGTGTSAGRTPANWLGGKFSRLTNPDTGDESARSQIRRLGFDPGDVGHIVLTHLDLDHAGGLIDFPRAKVHVYARELAEFLRPDNPKESWRYRRIQFRHGPHWSPHGESGEPWFGFEAVRELDGLPSEILLVPLAGHTMGHAAVAVDTGAGWLLHAGDAYFDPATLTGERTPAGLRLFEKRVETDRAHRLDNQRRLRELVRAHADEVTVFSAHNAAEFHALADRSKV